MNTILATIVGACVSVAFCVLVQGLILCGFGEPNVIPEAGETLIGWWFMLWGSTTLAFTLTGMFFDIVGGIAYMIRRD